MMLSTVSIFASGQTGQENINVYAGGEFRTFENVSTEGEVFVIETSGRIQDDLIAIEFTNDLYAPELGIDRNLTVEKIIVDGVTISTNDPNVFAEGVWDPASGQIIGGTGLGSTLHANGFFDFFIEASEVSDVEFAGLAWRVVDGGGANFDELSVANNERELTISGAAGSLAISTLLDVEVGGIYNLSFLAERLQLEGQFSSDSQPWATVGIDYYNGSGNLITQSRFDVNSQGPIAVEGEIEVPATATQTYLWVWIDGFDEGVNIPLKLSDLTFEALDFSDDTTPPTAEFNSFTFTENFDNEIGFGVEFRDETRLDFVLQNAITVTGPNGFNVNPPIVTGGFDNTDTFKLLVFGLTKPDGSDFTQSDNGVYTVTLNDSRVPDQAGNFAAGGVLGTITVDITQAEVDTAPPVVRLLSANDVFAPPTGGRGADIQFTVEYTDGRALGNFQDAILVEGPNGYSQLGQGIAGGAADPNGYFEITYIPLPADGFWNSNDNGTYTIKLLDNVVVDSSGNFTPGRDLGTFIVNIPGDDVELGVG